MAMHGKITSDQNTLLLVKRRAIVVLVSMLIKCLEACFDCNCGRECLDVDLLYWYTLVKAVCSAHFFDRLVVDLCLGDGA